MGTRNLTMVYFNGEYKIAQYGQWDGHINYTGVEILNFLKKYNIEYFKEKLNNCTLINKEKYNSLWREFGVDLEKNSLVEIEKMEQFTVKYPSLSRDTGWAILEKIIESDADNPVLLQKDVEFAVDSLFCEYAYVIDLDKNTCEIYTGFNQKRLAESDRFFFLQKESDNKYYPIKLLKSYSLAELPTKDELIALE